MPRQKLDQTWADAFELNRANWDERAEPHARSAEYGVQTFVDDPSHLSDVVRFDRERLGDIHGLRGVHLQCHIGTDTVSLHRLGAQMTGLDFSRSSLAQARDLAARTDSPVDFVEASVYDAPSVLDTGAYNLVYTGIGALCWLPDIAAWAGVVADLLAPGGRLFVREGHPVLWSIDETRTDALAIEYPYVERVEPTLFNDPGTYVETEHVFRATRTAEWSHGLGQIVTALLDAGLRLTMLQEHDSVPWLALTGRMERLPGGEYRLTDRPWRLPHSYTLQALKED